MKRSSLCIIAISALAFSQLAYCGTYVTGGGGFVIPMRNASLNLNSNNVYFAPTVAGASIFNMPNFIWESTFGNGWEGFLAAGFDVYPSMRLEAEFLYQNMQSSNLGTFNWNQVTPIGGDIFASSIGNTTNRTSSTLYNYNLIANLYYDFRNQSRWTPSVGLGLGIGRVHAAGTTSNNTLVINDLTTGTITTVPTTERSPALNSIVFAWQVKGAVAYAITPKLSVFGQYRLFRTSNYNINSSSITLNPGTASSATYSVGSKAVSGLVNSGFDLGLTYRFDA